ncbi:MAG: plasmid maintenance protein CcdB [Archangium gephyra]|uniref:Toxin CcdB n=1 Tax=Archangium gephyra TaxID=48 RepID=A0A2W5VGF6_9BACT|nr:MAG: plasmid maintenance protein CcdB [Archangium gephyra]
MAQFDVHRNPGKNRDAMPYVVVLQSAAYDGHDRRVVAPLTKQVIAGRAPHALLTPTFVVGGVTVFLNPFDLVSVPVGQLGPKVASLSRHGDKLIAALDQLFTRVWG